jgi:sugar O-acyltransferase (sialic acid O-acetyltransferase NeuD family)
MRRSLYVVGTGGLAREMAMLAEVINAHEHKWRIKGFISEDKSEIGKDLGIAPVAGDDDWLLSQEEEVDLVVGIGTPGIRTRVITPYLARKDLFHFPNLIHPASHLDYHRIELGIGNAITSGCSFTCDIVIGNFNLFNLNSTLGHDAVVGDFNVINPGVNISGGVTIGDRVLLGTGSQVLENLSIGSGVIVGAGAVVTKDLPSDVTVVGVPAKPIQ